jgi:twitching motility protein PilJ
MSNKASRANLMPIMAALGAILLLGVLVLLFNGQNNKGSAQQSDASSATLQKARSALLVARGAWSSGAPDSLESIHRARASLTGLSVQGLSVEQSRALSNLSTGLETLENNWRAREVLTFADAQLELLLPLLDDAANVLEEVILIQEKPLVVAQLERLRLLAEGLHDNVRSFSAGSVALADVTQQLLDRKMEFAQIIRGFEKGDPSLGLLAVADIDSVSALAALTKSTSRISENVQNVLAVTEELAALNAVGGQFNALDGALGSAGSSAAVPVNDALPVNPNEVVLALTAAALLIFLIMAGLWYRQRDIRKAANLQTAHTQQNQAAIMRLLDELSSLADGDLTIKATVNEDITGAIADSINYAIEALRELVVTLNDSAIRIDGAARQTDQTAEQLAEATAEQSRQIEDASQAILQMAASIEEISGNAERSSDVARHSVDVAHKGGDAVRRTIDGMNTIRETIQDTAKRIKRLGESSQEIGNIIELINDIADQTNILALNASIQASMAGEAGRGFAVVADEVQRLAERSANATKQIEVLVRTIQADTNEAVVSMERSTTDVIGGALLAENAGAALEEIEQVSNQIASLVQNISGSARGQSTAAAAVTRSVDMLQEINSRTEANTHATTGSIRELVELAAQLRESVAGFRLPGDEESPRQGFGNEPDYEDELIEDPLAAEPEAVKFVNRQTA